MASHASKFLSDRVQADGVDKNVWEWAENFFKNGLKLKYILFAIKARNIYFWRYSEADK